MLAALEPQGVAALLNASLFEQPLLISAPSSSPPPAARPAGAPGRQGIQKLQHFATLLRIRFFEQPADALLHHVIGVAEQQTANVEDVFRCCGRAWLPGSTKPPPIAASIDSSISSRPASRSANPGPVRDGSRDQPRGNAVAMRPVPDVAVDPLFEHPKLAFAARFGESPVEVAHDAAFLQHSALPKLGDEPVALGDGPMLHFAYASRASSRSSGVRTPYGFTGSLKNQRNPASNSGSAAAFNRERMSFSKAVAVIPGKFRARCSQ